MSPSGRKKQSVAPFVAIDSFLLSFPSSTPKNIAIEPSQQYIVAIDISVSAPYYLESQLLAKRDSSENEKVSEWIRLVRVEYAKLDRIILSDLHCFVACRLK
jgi:hypothetical protein